MKTFLKTSLVAGLSIFLLTGFSLRERPEDPPRGEKKKKLHMVKVENGKKTVIDTVIVGDGDAMSWFAEHDLAEGIDSIVKEKLNKIKVIVDSENGKENVKIFKFKDGDFDMDFDFDVTTETIMDGDSTVKVVIVKHGGDEIHEKIMHVKHGPHIVRIPKVPHPPSPHIKILKHFDDKNVIHLNDSDIISFKKKDMSGGREKIEIIRKKSKDEDIEVEVEVEVIEEDED